MSDRGRLPDRRQVLRACGAIGVIGVTGCMDDEEDGDGDSRNDRRDQRTRETNETDDDTDDAVEDTDDGSEDDDSASDETEAEEVDPDDPDVRIAVSVQGFEDPLQDVYRPLLDHVVSETGTRVGVVEASNDAEVTALLERGDAEMADVDTGAALDARDALDVVGIRRAFGAPVFYSVIATTPDSRIGSVSDLEGETIASGAPLSVSGTLFPLMMLTEAGLDIGGAPESAATDFELFYSDHATAREHLIEDDSIAAGAAGAFALAPHIPREQFRAMDTDFPERSAEYSRAGQQDPELRLLAVSSAIPRAPIVARSDWGGGDRASVESALLEAPASAFTQDASVQDLSFTGITPGTFSDFDPIVRLINALDISHEVV